MQLSQAPQVVMMLVLIGLMLGAGALSLSKFQGSLTAGTIEYQAVGNATKGLGDLSTQLPTIGVIIGVAILISVVLGAFYFGKK